MDPLFDTDAKFSHRRPELGEFSRVVAVKRYAGRGREEYVGFWVRIPQAQRGREREEINKQRDRIE